MDNHHKNARKREQTKVTFNYVTSSQAKYPFYSNFKILVKEDPQTILNCICPKKWSSTVPPGIKNKSILDMKLSNNAEIR